MKIVILGHPGCGKSTVANKFKEMYNIPVIHLDVLSFDSGWVKRDKDVVIKELGEFMKNESWIIDGNYKKLLYEERMNDADFIIYLNYPRIVSGYRVFKRYFKNRNKSRDSVAEGCDEQLDPKFLKYALWESRNKSNLAPIKKARKMHKSKFLEVRTNRGLRRMIEKTTL